MEDGIYCDDQDVLEHFYMHICARTSELKARGVALAEAYLVLNYMKRVRELAEKERLK
jgi:hypothetical protein